MWLFIVIVILVAPSILYSFQYAEFNSYNHHASMKLYVRYNKVLEMIGNGFMIHRQSSSYPNNFKVKSGSVFASIRVIDDFSKVKIYLNMDDIIINNCQICLYPIGYLRYLIWLMQMNKYPKAKEKFNKKEIIENIWRI